MEDNGVKASEVSPCRPSQTFTWISMDIALLIEQHGHRTGFTENQCCAYPNSIRPPVSYNCCFDRISSLLIIVILPFVSSFSCVIISLFNVSSTAIIIHSPYHYDEQWMIIDYCVPMANICVPFTTARLGGGSFCSRRREISCPFPWNSYRAGPVLRAPSAVVTPRGQSYLRHYKRSPPSSRPQIC